MDTYSDMAEEKMAEQKLQERPSNWEVESQISRKIAIDPVFIMHKSDTALHDMEQGQIQE